MPRSWVGNSTGCIRFLTLPKLEPDAESEEYSHPVCILSNPYSRTQYLATFVSCDAAWESCRSQSGLLSDTALEYAVYLPHLLGRIQHFFWPRSSVVPRHWEVLRIPVAYTWMSYSIPRAKYAHIYLVLYDNPLATQPSHHWMRRLG